MLRNQRDAILRPTADGRVYLEEEGTLHVYADTGGSPQHLVFDHLNQLYAADIAHAAVLHIKEDGGMQVLVHYILGAFSVSVMSE